MGLGDEQGETYTISAAASLLGATHRVLVDAVPPATLQPQGVAAPVYGWVSGAWVCASPSKSDRYVVEFVGKRQFRILAYIDRFGRVFSTNEPLTSPPARRPDLDFARFAEQDVPGEERGCVEVCAGGEGERQVAQYACTRSRYTLGDTWYDFGPYATDLTYDDALARAYLAFVYRPTVGGAEVPARGVAFVHECLRGEKLLPGLRAIVDEVRRTKDDPVVSPPALARNLVRWLEDAGLDGLAAPAVPDDALRLAKTAHYANLYYVALEDDDAPIDRHTIWALEAALNRFSLLEDAFGEHASKATDADCARWDAYLIEMVGAQPQSGERLIGAPVGVEGGEWEVRCRISAVLERLKLPIRIEVQMQANVAEGIVALLLTVPDNALMPARRWADAPVAGLVDATEEERDAQAHRYAQHLGLALALAAFEAAPSIERVEVAARPLGSDRADRVPDAVDVRPSGEFPAETRGMAYYQVALTRQAYEESGRFRGALEGDPTALLVHYGTVFDLPGADPFALVTALPSSVRRHELPEMADAALPETVRPVLGADDARDLRIVADARRRRIAEALADRIARASSATEAIRVVREEQDAAESQGDDQVVSACTRLMAALAGDTLDTEDQNAVVVCFLGEDRCLAALGRARALVQRDPGEAVAVLMDAVAEAAALDGYVDGAVTAYRAFDSYAARVLYDRALRAARRDQGRAGSPDTVPAVSIIPAADTPRVPTLALRATADVDKRILLVPDSFYLCHLEIVTLLERSFDRVDEALRYGQRAIELAPASAGGYRQLGRAYMLVGDMDNAIAVLEACLRVAVQPNDVAVAYYQLAYALWKADRPRAGMACYLKSLMTSPVVALQAMAELKELATEQGIEPMERDEVDDELRSAGIVVAPDNEVLAALDAGAAAAVDAGLFPVARNLLSLRLRYRPDDALVTVLKSLD